MRKIWRASNDLSGIETGFSALDKFDAENSLSVFIKQAWQYIDPATYVHGRHIDFVAEHLEAVGHGDIKTLFIMIPPGHMKSIMVSVMFPAWHWIHHPEDSFLSASHSLSLSRRDNVKCRRLIQSHWYQSLWGDRFQMTEDQNAKDFYQNDKMGFREIVSIGGNSTGRRAKFRLVDDAIDAMAALSDNVIQSTNEWYDTAYSSRFEDPKDNRLIAVAQRLAENDLMGHLMELHPEADVICLPARYESAHPISTKSTLNKTDWRSKEGDLLFPERYGEKEQRSIESKSSDFVIASQQQQRPDPKDGNVVHDSWWQYYDQIPAITRRVIYVDTALKVEEENDWTVFECWGLVPGKGIFLLDLERQKIKSPELRSAAKAFWDKHRKLLRSVPTVSVMKIEDKASGTTLIQELERVDRVNVAPIPRPSGRNKAARMIDFSPKIKNGFVFLPSGPTELTDAAWVTDFKKEFRLFRLNMSHAHDDMVDPALDAIEDLLLGNDSKKLVSSLYARR